MAAAGQTVRPVKGLKKEEWCKTVLERFANSAVRDTIYRLNEDATNRMVWEPFLVVLKVLRVKILPHMRFQAVALAPCLLEAPEALSVGL